MELNPHSMRAATTSATDNAHWITIQCERCQGAFRTMRLSLLGTEIVAARICNSCVERGKQEAEEAEKREKDAARERVIAERQAKLMENLVAAGVNAREYGDCTLDNFDPSECGQIVVQAARDFLNDALNAGPWDRVRGLYLFGGTGTGKTRLAVSIVREFLLDLRHDPSRVVFDYSARLITEIQDTYSTRRSVEDVIERRIQATLWILDDLGTEQASPDAIRRLTMLMNERTMHPTVITSNLSPEALMRRSPDVGRIISRLGPQNFRTIEVKGRDRRFD